MNDCTITGRKDKLNHLKISVINTGRDIKRKKDTYKICTYILNYCLRETNSCIQKRNTT